MLQQTRVETVVPYYERFVARFPDCSTLADAPEEEVLRRWAGLGYYARARNLKRAAGAIVRDHDGRVPDDPEVLRRLPGIGRYTAGAVASIAFGRPAPIVDGNVSRVLSRLQAIPSPSPKTLWALADALVPDERPGDFNQSLMELGATTCTPRAPRCGACPLSRLCRARSAGTPERFPAPRVRPRPATRRAIAGVLRNRTRHRSILMVRRPGEGLLGGLWELPSTPGSRVEALLEMLEEIGLRAEPDGRLGRVSHVFSHIRLGLEIVSLRHVAGAVRPSSGIRWCTPERLSSLPLSALARKSLGRTGLCDASSRRAIAARPGVC